MTEQTLAARKKGYVTNIYYNEKLNGKTQTDKEIQDTYDRIPVEGFEKWYWLEEAEVAYDRVKPWERSYFTLDTSKLNEGKLG